MMPSNSTPEIDAVYEKADEIAQLIKAKVPDGSIVPEHTFDSHHYRCHIFDGSPLHDSVTTKSGIISEGDYIKDWAIRTVVGHIRSNSVNNTFTEALLKLAQDEPNRIFKKAGTVGTEVHTAIETYLLDWKQHRARPAKRVSEMLESGYSSESLSAALAVEKFLNDHWVIPVFPEFLVASSKLKVAGTLDFLAYVGTETKPAGENTQGVVREYYQTKTSDDPRVIYVECVHTGHQVRFDLTIVDWKTSSSIEKPAYLLQVSAYRECLRELTGIHAQKGIIVRLDKKGALYQKAPLDAPQMNKAIKQYANVGEIYEWLKTQDSQVKVDWNKQYNILDVS